MAKKTKKTFGDMINDIKNDVTLMGDDSGGNIPDIETFVYDDYYLGFNNKKPPIVLYPVQAITLKAFYRNSIGNENLKLTEEEIKICKELGLDNDENGDVLSKWAQGTVFQELVLCWGRRSGKDFLSSIIALYEAMKLLEAPGGNPHAYYSVAPGQDITILTVANAAGQASIAFEHIKERLFGSPYFADKYIPAGFQKNSIKLMTPLDKEENKKRQENDLPIDAGSISIEVGHSNSDTLRGKDCFVLIADEVAMFKQTGGSASGDVIYQSLRPSITTYVRHEEVFDIHGNPVLDENGKPIINDIYDGKIISISTPRDEGGIFYRLFKEGGKKANVLVIKLPTWSVNINHTKEGLREEHSSMTEEEFEMEFGAEFSGTAGENMFPREKVNNCFMYGLKNKPMGEAGKVYFAHLDPASTTHNYALAICHKEIYVNPASKQMDFYVVVDHLKHWHPTPGNPVKVDEVHDYMIQLKRRFHFGMVTFDHWNSASSILHLRKAGIPTKETQFTRKYKIQIYDELYNLIVADKLHIPQYKLLHDEMIHLQKKAQPIGYRVLPKADGEVRTDDCCDAVAGACFLAVASHLHKLPKSMLVNMGNPVSNARVWRSMSGAPMGYGTGEQVSRRLEQRASWPDRRR
jgi:hypothetical protein